MYIHILHTLAHSLSYLFIIWTENGKSIVTVVDSLIVKDIDFNVSLVSLSPHPIPIPLVMLQQHTTENEPAEENAKLNSKVLNYEQYEQHKTKFESASFIPFKTAKSTIAAHKHY